MLTGIIGSAAANVTKRLGQFDAKNGLFFELTSGGIKRVVRRNNGSDTVTNQANWNIDPFDGTGPSGITIDWTKDQIFIIDYAWLGTARVRYGFVLNGSIAYCHASDHANALAGSYMQTAFLPIRYEISASGAASSVMQQICSAVATESGVYAPPGLVFSGGRGVGGFIATGSEVPLVAIRPALLFGSITNRNHIQLLNLDVIASAAPIAWRLLYYLPGVADPITGGAWAAADANSSIEINTGGTALSLTGAHEIISGYVAATAAGNSRSAITNIIPTVAAQAMPVALDVAGSGNPMTSNTGDNPAYVVISGLGTGATAGARIGWQEVR